MKHASIQFATFRSPANRFAASHIRVTTFDQSLLATCRGAFLELL